MIYLYLKLQSKQLMSMEDRMGVVKKKLLLVDDHAIVRAGFRYLLECSQSYEIKEVSSAEEACEIYNNYLPDTVVMDLMMPGMGGLEGVRHICAKDENAKILVLSMREDEAFVSRALNAGAKGYITKRSAPDELTKAVIHLISNKEYISTDIQALRSQCGKKSPEDSDEAKLDNLSEREFEVYRLLAEGHTVIDVSKMLHLSPKTVSNHRTHIMQKMKAKSIVELTRLAIRKGHIEA